ncbi:hypothetical protein [Paraburkholderia sp. J11-2]|uniref:hypothetical protein n=1 Tax=Paraburkholderia sp. J11-2 TaxID=2805431 RepID=UPI002AB7853E|nr:hypothetical protein [Paraburkholderia sp. J11-2]
MADIKLYSTSDAGGFTLKARIDDSTRVIEAILLSVGDALKGMFVLGSADGPPPITVLPAEFVTNGTLMSWSEIQSKVIEKAEASERARLEALRDSLRKQLADHEIDLDAQAGGFLGVSGVGNLTAMISASLSIDLLMVDPTLSPAPADDAVVLSATLNAQGQATLATNACTASFFLSLTLTRKGILSVLPSLSLDALPAIKCPFDFHWPKIAWPTLQWSDLDLSGLATLFRFDLPIPSPDDGYPKLSIDWGASKPSISFNVTNGKLALSTTNSGNGTLVCETSSDASTPLANIAGLAIGLDAQGNLTLQGKITATHAANIDLPDKSITQPPALPFTIDIDPGKLAFAFTGSITLPQIASADASFTATLTLPRVLIRAKSDPSLVLALRVVFEEGYTPASGKSAGKIKSLDIVDPYPFGLVGLIAREAADTAAALIRFVSAIPIPQGNTDTGLLALLERIAAMASAAIGWLAQQVISAAETLIGIAQGAADLLAQAVKQLFKILQKASFSHPYLVVETRLDARTFALRQVIVSPAWDGTAAEPWTGDALGLTLDVPYAWRPSLIVDLDSPVSIALAVTEPAPDTTALTLGTDLWLRRDTVCDAVRDSDGKDGQRVNSSRVIQATVIPNITTPLILVRYSSGAISFLEKMSANIQPLPAGAMLPVPVSTVSGAITYSALSCGPKDNHQNDIQLDITVAPGTATRLLPFLQSSGGTSPSTGTGTFIDTLKQYVTIENGDPPKVSASTVDITFNATLHIRKASGGETTAKLPIDVQLDLHSMQVRLKSIETVEVESTAADSRLDLLGLSGQILPRNVPPGGTPAGSYPIFKLDFSSGDMRLSLANSARLDLTYDKVASQGRGIVFCVDEFIMSRNGIDLSARVDPQSPVQLAGVDMPFRFHEGGLLIRNGQIQSFSINGSGQLPPDLIGEANASISITMGRGSDGTLIVQSADARLDMSGSPIVCHATCFTFSLAAIGLRFHDFSAEGGGYHFYFTLTGTARFTPQPGAFAEGLLKNFASLTITLDQTPLARDPSMLARAISFQVNVEPKARINFFNLFTFELRGIGFHPKSPAFNGDPAMSISGQLYFLEGCDIPSESIICHELMVARAPLNDWRPRVRFDGLSVAVRFGGSATIEGTAIAVDDTLPTLFAPGALPANVTARGFLAAGKLSIKGWGQMSASMGFLELRKDNGAPRQAFFVYGEEDKLSIEIPTPLAPIYLREVGFGFGFRYTLAAFNRADQVTDVKGLIDTLDGISKYQGELASVNAWEPEPEGDRLTLALRGLITIASASGENEYNESGEEDLPNPVLFDIVAALRSDLTFFMNARVWLARNYADWVNSSATSDAWRTNPTMRGYMYLSVPRSEFLGRLIADGTGDVEGTHPQLPEPLVKAMKAIRWSATIYIRPGLFHQEFGWPYELGFTLAEKDVFQIDCSGGLVNRIEDLSVLYGVAFRAKGFAQIGGTVGGRSFGASVSARADFSLDAKFIAYLSLKRFGDTLFYGALACDVAISLQVRVWLNFSAGFFDVHLEVGFSMSLTISVALEVALSPAKMGGRACASVAVGAFGRTLRLGVGFGFNEDMLESARQRVARFLSLGLSVALPDAQQGVAPAGQTRGAASRDADRSLDQSLDKQDKLAEPAPAPPPAAGAGGAAGQAANPPTEIEPSGRALPPTGYWAMLFPVRGEQQGDAGERFVMILVPRDHSETGLTEEALPRHFNGNWLGTFYAPPEKPDDSTPTSRMSIRLLSAGEVLPGQRQKIDIQLLDPGSTAQPARSTPLELTDTATALPYRLDHPAIVAAAGTLTLGQVLTQCFIVDSDNALKEPLAREVKTDAQRLPPTREAAAQVLAAAARDQLDLQTEARAANAIEERRASIVAALCESATKLADGGDLAWATDPSSPGFDIRLLGVAFVVTRTNIDELFGSRAPDAATPACANFVIDTTEGKGQQVHLFNPPESMFRERSPQLTKHSFESTPHGVLIDWDLEPAFGPSSGVWNDPEFDLKHYYIERVAMTADGNALYPPRPVTAKATAPLRLIVDPVTGELVWGFTRPNAQYVDDLSDLPPADSRAILQGKGNTLITSLHYVIKPVDTAGTQGCQSQFVLKLNTPASTQPCVRRAVLNFEYRDSNAQLRGPWVNQEHTAKPDVTLGIDDSNDDGVQNTMPTASGDNDLRPPLDKDRTYRLRVRRERGVPSGLYGSDAVTDALTRPSAADFDLKHATDTDFLITLPAKKSDGQSNQIPSYVAPLELTGRTGFSLPDDAFFEAIGVTSKNKRDSVIAVRFAIRPEYDPASETPGAWCPTDITILFAPPQADTQHKAMPIAAPVEIYEHPLAVDAAPLMFDDLAGEAGRVVIRCPDAQGLTETLVENLDQSASASSALEILPDIRRRVATRLRWNARPAAEGDKAAAKDDDATDNSATRLAPFFGGFDLFEFDAGSDANGASTHPFALRLACDFDASTHGRAPAKATFSVNAEDFSAATTLLISTTDLHGDRSHELDEIDQSPERVKGHLRLVSTREKWKWAEVQVSAMVRADGYRMLSIESIGASGIAPFGNGDTVDLVFTRMTARHLTRVQALPETDVGIDPPAITDFSKVEAHYPGETARLGEGTSRLAGWYSPAESFVVWPQRPLRRALSINVDETVVTALLANGRPTGLRVTLTIGSKAYLVKPLPPSNPKAVSADQTPAPDPDPAAGTIFDLPPNTARTVSAVRKLLRNLSWEAPARDVFDRNRNDLRNARVQVAALKNDPSTPIATAQWQVDLDPDLHPVLADTIDRVRYAGLPESEFPSIKPPNEWKDASGQPLSEQSFADCQTVRFSITDWPANMTTPEVILVSGDGAPAQIDFTRIGVTSAGRYGLVRNAAGNLSIRLSASKRAKLFSELKKNSGFLKSVQLILLCDMKDGTTQIASGTFDLVTNLCDTGGAVYRRYEPVLEPLPKTSAADVTAWMDDSPPQRDPYGWGVLRMLGLAVGLRLYDTETNGYLRPDKALPLLNQAFDATLVTYQDISLGAPFIDVLTRAGATMELTSFDGDTPAMDVKETESFITNNGLALMQIALRPLPNPCVEASGSRPVAYFAIQTGKNTTSFDIDLSACQLAKDDPLQVIVADVLDLSTSLASAPLTTLAFAPPSPDSTRNDMLAALISDMTDKAGAPKCCTINVQPAAQQKTVALVRMTVVGGDATALGNLWIRDSSADGVGSGATAVCVSAPKAQSDAETGNTVTAEPFGSFNDMSPKRWTALALNHPQIQNAIATLKQYTAHRWADGWPQDVAQIASRLANWTRRFLDYGPGTNIATPTKPPKILFSIGEVTRPDPWRIAVQDDGTMDVLFTHDDRKRRLKRYAVKPFGRYDSFVAALRSAQPGAATPAPNLYGAWTDAIQESQTEDFEQMWAQRLCDIVLPRSEPIAPPVLVDARRVAKGGNPKGDNPNDDNRNDDNPNGDNSMLEFVYKRHPEEILSEANVTAEGALSFESVSVGFWREFPMQRWALDMCADCHIDIDTAAAFGSMDSRPPAPSLIVGDNDFAGLAGKGGRFTDGWQGALVLRTDTMPFFFRTHAAAYASAGVVVSEPVIATIEEGSYVLNCPWDDINHKSDKPSWTVERRTGDNAGVNGVYIVFSLPLVRFIDGMTAASREAWLTDKQPPEVFTLPDPLANYEIRACANGPAGVQSASPELTLIGQQRTESLTPDDTNISGFRVSVVGPLFTPKQTSVAKPVRHDGASVWWRQDIEARLNPTADHPPAEAFAPFILLFDQASPLTRFELEPDAFALDSSWPDLAPRAAATLNVSTPVPNDAQTRAKFAADLTVWRDLFAKYANDAAAHAARDFIQAWIDFVTAPGAPQPPVSKRIDNFTLGLPYFGTGRPSALAVKPDSWGDWRAPAYAGIARRTAIGALKVSASIGNYDQSALQSTVLDPVVRAMRSLTVMRKDAEVGNRFPGIAPYVWPVQPALTNDALVLALAARNGKPPLPPCADVIVAIPITVDNTHAARSALRDLIDAVEKARFTATTITDLGALEDGASSALVHFPAFSLAPGDVTNALSAPGLTLAAFIASAFVLRQPPTDDDTERPAIIHAIQTSTANQIIELTTQFNNAMTAQLFGEHNVPHIKIVRGTAPIVDVAIERG